MTSTLRDSITTSNLTLHTFRCRFHISVDYMHCRRIVCLQSPMCVCLKELAMSCTYMVPIGPHWLESAAVCGQTKAALPGLPAQPSQKSKNLQAATQTSLSCVAQASSTAEIDPIHMGPTPGNPVQVAWYIKYKSQEMIQQWRCRCPSLLL